MPKRHYCFLCGRKRESRFMIAIYRKRRIATMVKKPTWFCQDHMHPDLIERSKPKPKQPINENKQLSLLDETF